MEPNKQRSLVQFVRKSLGYKGETEHSGRGSYWCGLPENVKWQRIKEEVLKKAERWKKDGRALEVKEELVEGVEALVVRFDPKVYGSYNMLYMNKVGVQTMNMYTIQFTMDSFNKL